MMEKVKCLKCGSIGYTAAPHSVKCSKCGGEHKVIEIEQCRERSKELAVEESLEKAVEEELVGLRSVK